MGSGVDTIMQADIKTSIIIRVYNEEQHIEKVDAWNRQSEDPFYLRDHCG
jgi:hypothetical protein